MLGTFMINKIKKATEAQDAVNRLMALGMEKKAAKIFADRLATACRKSGCTPEEKKRVNILATQIMAMGKAGEDEMRTLAESCPYLFHQIMTHYGYQHRALIRHAAAGRFTAEKFIAAVMNRVGKD